LPERLPKRLIVGFCIVISMINDIVWYHATILITILIVERKAASPGAGRKMTSKRRVASVCHDLLRR
jgi:hypothetical protein